MMGKGVSVHQLHTLGGLSLERGGRTIIDDRRHRLPLLLLTWIAMTGHRGASREQVLSYFWPDHAEARASHNLSQALYILRRAASSDSLISGRQRLLVSQEELRVDASLFEGDLASGRVDEAIARYEGHFLEGVAFRGCPSIARWAERQRERLRYLYRDALERVTIRALGEGNPARVLKIWSEPLDEELLDARAAVHLAHAHVANGDLHRARSLLRRHVESTPPDEASPDDDRVRALLASLSGGERR